MLSKWVQALLTIMLLFGGGAAFGFMMVNVSITAANQTHIAVPTPSPSPTPIVAPQKQMGYADWQKQEASRVKVEQDRKAFEESNASECYVEILNKNGEKINFAQEYYSISRGKIFYYGPGSFEMIMYYGTDKVLFPISQAKTVCTGKRNGVDFTEVQSVVRWDSAGNEIENVTFTRG